MPHRFASRVRRLLLPLALVGAGGCTALGMMAGTEKSDRDWGRPVFVDSAAAIAHGTPVQVQLRDGGYVRGIALGMTSADSADAPGPRPALKLGVGNRIQLDRLFETGATLAEPTREHVPDTLVFPLDRLAGLRAPGGSGPGFGAPAAAGLAIDTVIIVVIATSAAIAAFAWLINL